MPRTRSGIPPGASTPRRGGRRARRGHRLDENTRHCRSEPPVDDRLAQRFESPDASASCGRPGRSPWHRAHPASRDVRQHPLERIGVKVTPAHLDNRAEAAVERAAPRCLEKVNRRARAAVAAEQPALRSGGRSGGAARRAIGRSALRMKPAAADTTDRQSSRTPARLHGTQSLGTSPPLRPGR